MRWAILLAGGSGTRLWPLSRRGEPKQFLPLLHGKSLITSSYERMLRVVPTERLLVCAAERHRKRVQMLIPSLPDANYLGEPVGRDTLAAIAFSCSIVQHHDPDAVVSIIPIDQASGPDRIFCEAMEHGFAFIEQNSGLLLTFGICPTEAATGYGYLECDQTVKSYRDGDEHITIGVHKNNNENNSNSECKDSGIYNNGSEHCNRSDVYAIGGIHRFLEKPERSLAEKFWLAGPKKYLWNAGMFLWHVRTFLVLLKQYEPHVFDVIREITQAWGTKKYPVILSQNYPSLPKNSIDYAFMERAALSQEKRVMTLPMPHDFQWRDVGTWDSVAELYPADAHGNAQCSTQEIIFVGSENCFVFADSQCTHKHKIRLVNVQNIIVVETPRTILVCERKTAEKVRQAARLRLRFHPHAVQGGGRFLDCFDCRLAMDHCRQNVVVVGLNEIDLLMTGESMTIVPSERPAKYETFHTLRQRDWLPIVNDNECTLRK